MIYIVKAKDIKMNIGYWFHNKGWLKAIKKPSKFTQNNTQYYWFYNPNPSGGWDLDRFDTLENKITKILY